MKLEDLLTEADKLLPAYELRLKVLKHTTGEEHDWFTSGKADYYKYLALCVKLLKPHFVLELGTCTGASAICMASELPNGDSSSLLVTVDHSHKLLATQARTMPHVHFVCADTLAYIPQHHIDFMFIDAHHDPARVLEEVDRYVPYCSPGAVLAFDDITLDDMPSMWAQLPYLKFARNHLHTHGFGFCQLPGKEE